jgi:predicted AAA+ superfamily ATPase
MTPSDGTPEPWIPRALDLAALVAKRSHFLLGPRQTGKTSLLRAALPEARLYDLLDSATYLALSQHPGQLAEELQPRDRVVVIDEIQRLPELLNEVHRLIEARGTRSCSPDRAHASSGEGASTCSGGGRA